MTGVAALSPLDPVTELDTPAHTAPALRPLRSPPPPPEAPPDDDPDVADRPALAQQLAARAADLWRVRGLLHQLALRDVRVRYKQAVLGVAWALLSPALVVLAGVTLRLTLARGAGHATDLAAVVAIAVKAAPWSFFSAAVLGATTSLTSSAPLLTKIYFPREALPLATVLAHLMDLGAGVATVALLVAVAGTPLSAALLWVPVLLALLVLLAVAAGLVLSCLNLFYRDVKYIAQVLLTFGIFFTPVFFDLSMLSPPVARTVMANPVAPLLEGLRLAVVERHPLLTPHPFPGGAAWSPWHLAYSAAWASLGLLLAVVLFARLERRFADHV